MKNMTSDEKKVRDYYDNFWTIQMQMSDENLILGCHYGYYERGINNWKEAVLNMNDFVGKLVGLDNNKKMEILDAGSGAGSVSNYLASKFPNINFTGITLSLKEVELAMKMKKEKHISNTKFIVGNYNETGFLDSSFDGVFAIECSSYTQNKIDFIHEMHRVLKPGGKFVISDAFLINDISLNSFMKKAYLSFLKKRGLSDLVSIRTFESYLEAQGFKEIDIRNISKNLINYYLSKDFLIYIFRFISDYFKKIIKYKKIESKKDVKELEGIVLIEFLLGLTRKINHYIITAVKKKNSMSDKI